MTSWFFFVWLGLSIDIIGVIVLAIPLLNIIYDKKGKEEWEKIVKLLNKESQNEKQRLTEEVKRITNNHNEAIKNYEQTVEKQKKFKLENPLILDSRFPHTKPSSPNYSLINGITNFDDFLTLKSFTVENFQYLYNGMDKQRNQAMIALAIIITGFILQILGNGIQYYEQLKSM